jgi:hypothetical protein
MERKRKRKYVLTGPSHLGYWLTELIRVISVTAEVEVTLRLTVSQSVYLGVGHSFGALTIFSFPLSFAGNWVCSSSWDTLSDERTGLQFVAQSVGGQSPGGLITVHYHFIWDYWIPVPSPLTTRRDYGGSILTHLHTGSLTAWSVFPCISVQVLWRTQV